MNNEIMSISKRESELASYLDRQPYLTELDGISLEIAKNVFPSDFGITSSFFGHFMLQQKPGSRALDMGCGSGYFALLLKKMGCQTVLGVDFNKDAFNCATSNAMRNPELASVEFIHSDLFVNVSPRQFDLIVFNFNYYPSNGVYGLNPDGGQEILKRFFKEVSAYINQQTRIYIPYSLFVGEEHDPKNICTDFGFIAKTVAAITNESGDHVIYEVMLT
ncbi:MAG: methyltransferase [Methylococcales bacterium]|jgi:methylase of polypeptide subunit release factors|nr:methyltransferase [Methylococcales bacterium]